LVISKEFASYIVVIFRSNDVLIQFDLLMMSTWCSKHVQKC